MPCVLYIYIYRIPLQIKSVPHLDDIWSIILKEALYRIRNRKSKLYRI